MQTPPEGIASATDAGCLAAEDARWNASDLHSDIRDGGNNGRPKRKPAADFETFGVDHRPSRLLDHDARARSIGGPITGPITGLTTGPIARSAGPKVGFRLAPLPQ